MADTPGARGQETQPETSHPADQHHPDQKALTKRERLLAYYKAYYQQHKTAKQQYNHRYYQLHPTERNAKRRLRYRKNPDPFLTASR